MAETTTPVRALGLICSLKRSPDESSSALIAEDVFKTMRGEGAECEAVRCVDYAIAPGIEADMGDGDEWPKIREKVMAADVVLLSTPIWLGHASSVTQRVLERLNADMSTEDDQGRPVMAGKVAIVSVVGNEDGAHKVVADVFQGLNDLGFSIPAQGCTYWNGPAMGSTDYKDIDEVPESVASATAAAARNAMHLARTLRQSDYPPYQ
ncbi:flavodoxin [Mycolicibacterium duvalii]|uniref:Flavodoxin n=1 Tax=Mycolicibacterium duvalii TaxID=39688 RepID=A0A7I7KAL5_9MYCO|nr:NAD(P)H-dependent oxidoreductase [Mycolicibacterium duvalii]MCV7368425.1 NAD(P)H-dependent oxidoreductase [Mycolicibacterium duvalii]PEG41852.1 flavodoxin [Mycolicibacterium duvalii]BBX20528.1 flavodoxin [Mycolicibacterium duvalii]